MSLKFKERLQERSSEHLEVLQSLLDSSSTKDIQPPENPTIFDALNTTKQIAVTMAREGILLPAMYNHAASVGLRLLAGEPLPKIIDDDAIAKD